MSNSSIITRVPATGHDYASFVSPLPHPGRLLREDYLLDYGLTEQQLADGLALPLDEVEAVLAGRSPISADFALRLGKAFRQDPNLWLRMQASHDLSKAAISAHDSLARIQPLTTAIAAE